MTQITLHPSADLTLALTARQADGTLLASLTPPATTLALAPTISGTLFLQVTPTLRPSAAVASYDLAVQQVLPPPPPPPAPADPALAPDALEDNWSPAHAAPIAVGVIYDLTFVCPVAGGCPGGDHDYLRVTVKAGLTYRLATFDLGPGTDTVLDLFWGDEHVPVAHNDDAFPGFSLHSLLTWTAPSDGEAVIRLAPRTGALQPIVTDADAGRYRFAITLAESSLGREIRARSEAQSGRPPTPTPPPLPSRPVSPAPAPVAPPAAAPAAAPPAPTAAPPSTDAPTGAALVITEASDLHEGPRGSSAVLTSLPEGHHVTLLGQASGVWVRVQPHDLVMPGWMRGTDLRMLEAAPLPDAPAEGLPPSSEEAGASPASAGSRATATAVPSSLRVQAIQVVPLEPLPVARPAPPPARSSRSVTVSLRRAPTAANLPAAMRTTDPQGLPLSGVRVQVLNAFDDLLAEAVTPADGTLVFTREVDPEHAWRLRIPALGMHVEIDQAVLIIEVPATGDE
ncbi:SH3 domain-containing protein [Candidatus Chloroploca sp. Khr17]|uniref:SH3 domain-containing protein n=1 Tax=Candidatus Chloroploca sp. Khr17 TaxID=2496869 RepID=UPI00196B7DEB|nr:SH3 domain-containing protein [Candidatus Chloroploca sp. Khr17]